MQLPYHDEELISLEKIVEKVLLSRATTTEIIHSDWFKLITQLATSNQSAFT